MTIQSTRRRLAALLFVLAVAAGLPAAAQQTGSGQDSGAQTAPAGPSAQELQGLIDSLQDPAQRDALVGQLQTLLEAKRQQPAASPQAGEGRAEGLAGRISEAVSRRIQAVAAQLGDAVDALERIPASLRDLYAGLVDPQTRARWAHIAVRLVAVMGAGVLAELLVGRLLARPRRSLEGRVNDSLVLRVLYLLARLVLDAIPIAAFAAVAYAVMPLLGMLYLTQLVAVTLINARVLSRAVTALGRAALAPDAGALRLPRLTDETAQYLFIWLRRIVVTAIYGYFLTEAFLLLGLEPGAKTVLQKLLGLAVAALIIVFLLQNRAVVGRWLRGRDGQGALKSLRSRFAELWHILAILYVAAIYGVWALEIQGGFAFLLRATVLTIVVVAGARIVRATVDRLITRGFHLSAELRRAYPGLEARANRYLPALTRIAHGLIGLAAGLLVLQIWGAGAFAWLTSNLGQALVSRLLTIAFIITAAIIAWELVSAFVERLLTRASRHEDPKQAARLMTLLPLVRNAVRVVLAVLVLLIVLSELGIDIGPLLAGAGVIGLAIGFGAQTLVKDVITGVFILVEDSLSVGDWVEISGHSGEVEAMTIRTIQLRDLSGHLHVVPFSDVTSILNMARDYGYAVIDVTVAFREDSDEVIGVLQQVAAELKDDPDWGPNMVGDLEVFGVNALGERGLEVRVRQKTKPLQHWGIRREFLRRAKYAFDAAGIEIPYPHRTLDFGVDRSGTAQPARVALQRAPKTTAEQSSDATPSQTSSTTPEADVTNQPEDGE